LFGLLSLLCLVRYLRTPRTALLAGMVAADLAAFASYEPMIVLPLFHLAIAFQSAEAKPRNWRPLMWLIGAHAALAMYRRLVLGSHISYGFRPVSLQSLGDIKQDYWPYARSLLVPVWILPTAALALIARRNRDLARAALWTLAGVLVIMLPFLVFRGAASRFFYGGMLGVALLLVILIQGVARLLPPRLGLPVLVVICALLAAREIRHAEAETQDWVGAGDVGKDMIAKIAVFDPRPDPNAMHLVLNLPLLVGNGELFGTYADRAIRRFSRLPFYALLAGHEVVQGTGEGEVTYLRKLLGEEDQWRVSQKMPPLLCLDAKLAAANSAEMFLRGSAACGLDVIRVDYGVVSRVDMDQFWQWYGQNKKG